MSVFQNISKLETMTNGNIDIKKLIDEIGLKTKFMGVAPEGFVLVHEKTLEDLKNWYNWESWKKGEISIEEMNKNNFENT